MILPDARYFQSCPVSRLCQEHACFDKEGSRESRYFTEDEVQIAVYVLRAGC